LESTGIRLPFKDRSKQSFIRSSSRFTIALRLRYSGNTPQIPTQGAPSAQAGLAAASLQVAETVGVSAGAGAGGTLIAVAVHLEHDLSVGLGWAFVLLALAIVLALVPASTKSPIASISLD
jgi:hypothetical protein